MRAEPVSRQPALNEQAAEFAKRLGAIKSARTDVKWYPYDSIANIGHLTRLLPADLLDSLQRRQMTVLDVGAADGDVAFLLESLGGSVDVIDNPPTNFNGCRGLAVLKEELGSSVTLSNMDVDRPFRPLRNYDLVLALGILYHLRNPFAFLMSLAACCNRIVLSTRVSRLTPQGMNMTASPVAYLLEAREANNDPTNFWIFSPAGLERLLQRCGWQLVSKLELGHIDGSNPVDRDRDERHFVYCERMPNWQKLIDNYDI